MIRRLIIILSALTFTTTTFAQTGFMDEANDATSQGVAGADIAYGSSALLVVDNFAGVFNCSEKIAVATSYAALQPNYLNSQIYQVGGYFKTMDRLAIGAAYRAEILPEQPVINSSGSVSGGFKPLGMVIDFGAAYSLTPHLSLGANAHYILTDVYTMNHQDLGFNLSANYIFEHTSAAVVLRNLGGSDSYISQPQSVDLGASHSFELSDEHLLGVMGRMSYIFAPKDVSSPIVAIGAEYSYNSLYFLRVGYRFADPQKYSYSYTSIGAGVAYAGFRLDGSYLIGDNPLGGSFILGLTWKK